MKRTRRDAGPPANGPRGGVGRSSAAPRCGAVRAAAGLRGVVLGTALGAAAVGLRRTSLRAAASLMLALGLCGGASAQVLEGRIRFVIDGDTVVFQTDAPGDAEIRLRLLGIDAPEICQAGGVEAREALVQLTTGRRAMALGAVRDGYHRRLVTLLVEGEDVGKRMVRDGHAWSPSYRGRPGRYAAQEGEARAARRGLFAATDPLPPRRFRQLHGSCHLPHP